MGGKKLRSVFNPQKGRDPTRPFAFSPPEKNSRLTDKIAMTIFDCKTKLNNQARGAKAGIYRFVGTWQDGEIIAVRGAAMFGEGYHKPAKPIFCFAEEDVPMAAEDPQAFLDNIYSQDLAAMSPEFIAALYRYLDTFDIQACAHPSITPMAGPE